MTSHVKIDERVEVFFKELESGIPMTLVTSLEIQHSESWTIQYLNTFKKNFPSLTKLCVDGNDARQENSILNFQNIVKAIWELPLEHLEIRYIKKDNNQLNFWEQSDTNLPVFQTSLKKLVLIGLNRKIGNSFMDYLFSPQIGCPKLIVVDVEIYLDSLFNSLAKSSPMLQELNCLSKNPTCNLEFPELKCLKLTSRDRRSYSVELTGSLPNLETVNLDFPNNNQLALAVLQNCRHLKSVVIRSLNSYDAVEPLIGYWVASNISPKLVLTSGRLTESELRKRQWDQLTNLISLGFSLSVDSVVALMNNLQKFDQVKDYLQNQNIIELDLKREVHSFVLKDLQKLSYFTNLRSIDIFDADDVTSLGFSQLLETATSLEVLSLTNARINLSSLYGRNEKLKSLSLLHCHGLISFDLFLPTLETLRLDNCDGEDFEGGHPNSCDTYGGNRGCRCYGNFQELVLKSLLDGSDTIQLPSLKQLALNHNPNSHGGCPPVYEELRVDIECTRGHPTLEELSIYNCLHIRKLRLQNLPQMHKLSLSSQAEDEDDLWLEDIQINLPELCNVTVEHVVAAKPKIAYSLNTNRVKR